MAESIKASAAVHASKASRHRLNQLPRAPNANLVKASLVQQRHSLKLRAKVDNLRVDSELWLYPKEGKAARKVWSICLIETVLIITT